MSALKAIVAVEMTNAPRVVMLFKFSTTNGLLRPNPDKSEPNRKAKRESRSTGRDRKAPYTSQRLENEVSIKLLKKKWQLSLRNI